MTLEHEEQVGLFEWIDRMETAYPLLGLAFAIPNGGFRHITTAKKLKAEGVRAGVPDVFLAYPSSFAHGLFIEMKVGKNKPTENQLKWHEKLRAVGYHVAVCYSWTEAAFMICDYLGLPKNIIPEALK